MEETGLGGGWLSRVASCKSLFKYKGRVLPFLFPSETSLSPSYWEMVGRGTHPTALQNRKGGRPWSQSQGKKSSRWDW